MKAWLLALLAATAALGADVPLRRLAREFPPLSELPSTPFALQDATLSAAGLRAAAADLAWIQLLQYAAGSLDEVKDAPDKPYASTKALTLRVVRLDPSFHRAYLFGAGILGFFPEVQRPEEAAQILAEGMRRDPGQPLYGVYLAALAYKRRGDVAGMTALLEAGFDDPRTPSLMKAILANVYKSQGDYPKALATWERILDSEADASEHPRALLQIAELKRLLREKRAPARR